MFSNTEPLRAIGRLMGRIALDRALKATAADDVIETTPLLPDWKPGVYEAGDVRRKNGQPWRCMQAHDSTGQTGWGPVDTPALWAPYHATRADYALPWVTPAGAHDLYKAGEYMKWHDGTVYRALIDTAFSPIEYAQAWEEI